MTTKAKKGTAASPDLNGREDISPRAPKRLTQHNNTDILGLVLDLLSGSSESPTPGIPAWAVEQIILEKWQSIEAFGVFFDAQSLEERRGWISQLKGRAAEHLVAHETDGEAHDD